MPMKHETIHHLQPPLTILEHKEFTGYTDGSSGFFLVQNGPLGDGGLGGGLIMKESLIFCLFNSCLTNSHLTHSERSRIAVFILIYHSFCRWWFCLGVCLKPLWRKGKKKRGHQNFFYAGKTLGLKYLNAASSKNSKLSKHAACGKFLQRYRVAVGDERLRENPEIVFLITIFLSHDSDFQHGSVVPLASHSVSPVSLVNGN